MQIIVFVFYEHLDETNTPILCQKRSKSQQIKRLMLYGR